MDEKLFVLHGDVIKPLNMRQGSVKKVDYEYTRHGYCAITSLIEALTGKQSTDVRRHRTAINFADIIEYLVEVLYPKTKKIMLVMDNLNTHRPGSL
ncbi:transposase [Lacticaseibacillus paracasei]|uniref:transposase n=1 Tax=Lacticaseibacillus paracasei TaxID=1597 RepID=UPI0009B774C4|nr:transposase [Lacticaseibacillus paracasei]